MNRPITDWRGKRVWLIGASSGIGEAAGMLLLGRGARVAFSARNGARLAAIVAAAGAAPAHALALPLDVTDRASVGVAFRQILDQWDGLDLMLVLAGGYNEMRADAIDLAAVNGMIDLNLRGAFNCLDAVLPHLLARGAGGVGLVASVAGYGGLPKALVYGPTKAALINLTEALYLDLHRRGLAVYQINPGFVDTPLTANNDFAMPALMSAHEAALAMVGGIERGQFHIHFPRRFTDSLRLARLLPYRLYFWLVHKVTGL